MKMKIFLKVFMKFSENQIFPKIVKLEISNNFFVIF
ncbi:hypothetical protein YTXLTZUM_CDS0165 [Enterococcus phage VRE9_3]